MHKVKRIGKIIILLVAMGMAGCTQSTVFEINRDTLDPSLSFTIAPLTTPPIYGIQKPIAQADTRIFLNNSTELNKEIVLGKKGDERKPMMSANDALFLQRAQGGRPIDDNIRTIIDSESLLLWQEDQKFFHNLRKKRPRETLSTQGTTPEIIKHPKQVEGLSNE